MLSKDFSSDADSGGDYGRHATADDVSLIKWIDLSEQVEIRHINECIATGRRESVNNCRPSFSGVGKLKEMTPHGTTSFSSIGELNRSTTYETIEQKDVKPFCAIKPQVLPSDQMNRCSKTVQEETIADEKRDAIIKKDARKRIYKNGT